MSGLFPKPKTVKAPEVPPPAPIPEVGEETGDLERKKQFRRGRSQTFITGELEPMTTGKKTLLG